MIRSRMQVGMKTYKQRYPAADVLHFEPDRGDSKLFFQNMFRDADRKRLAEHAYQRTRHDLRAQAGQLSPILERHGITLSMPVLEDVTRSFGRAVRERRRRSVALTGPLHVALDRLAAVVGHTGSSA